MPTTRMEPFSKTKLYSKRFHVIPAAYPRAPRTVISPDIRLELAVNEYNMSTSDPKALTLVFTHGTSFNKEFWEPIIQTLVNDSNSYRIKRILAIDAVTHGDSAVINAGRLEEKTFWPDHSYDILRTMEHFCVTGPVVGIGHSFGGGTLAHAAMISPSRFTATIFVEPILYQWETQTKGIANMALRRRDKWKDLEEVKISFNKSKGMADWAPEQRLCYAEKGTFQTTDGSQTFRTLKTSKEQEAATYLAAPLPELPDLLAQSKYWHFYVLGGKSDVIKEESRELIKTYAKTPGKVIVMNDCRHLIPMTHPIELSKVLGDLLTEVYCSQGEGTKMRRSAL